MRDVEAQLIHDMRNALVVVRAAAVQLSERGPSMSPATVAHLSEMLARRSDMLVRLFDDLATAHQLGRADLRLNLRAVDVAELCHSVLDQRLPATDTTIRVDVAEDVLAIADPVRLNQVLDNLVTNAVKYGGPHVTVSATLDETTVRLRVADDGPGIARHLVSSLFQAYTRGHDTDHGTSGLGLGLSIVKQLCEAMHGFVAYDGAKGSAFVVTVPALPRIQGDLGSDPAARGHSALFWQDDDQLAAQVARYAAIGLRSGEAALVIATPEHLQLIERRLGALGVDVAAVGSSGQYRTLDAAAAHRRLAHVPRLDDELVAGLLVPAVDDVRRDWRACRVFGEVVDLFWREGDSTRALDLEAWWNQQLCQTRFPLLCGYQLAEGREPEAIRDCHNAAA